MGEKKVAKSKLNYPVKMNSPYSVIRIGVGSLISYRDKFIESKGKCKDLHQYSYEELLESFTCFGLTESKLNEPFKLLACAAINRETYELTNLFSFVKGRGSKLLGALVEIGATNLNCFDGKLVEYYEKHGFKIVKKEENWTKGGPAVVYMKHKNQKRGE